MRIKRIASSGFLAVKNIEVDVRSPIVLFCGTNEAGKSSLRDGIHQAFTGENPRVQLKKNYKFLVNDKDHAGYTYVDYDGNQKAAITIPNGTHELTQALHSALPYVLNPALFASITPDDRAKFLFDLGNLRSDGTEVKQKLLDRGCDAGKVDEIMPFLRSSFENANKQAIERTKEARTSWKTVTTENYGDKKAEGWKAPQAPVVDDAAKEKAEAELSRIDAELEQENQKLGAMQAALNGANHRAGEITRLRELAEKESRIREKLDHDRHQVEEWQTKIEETRKLALGSRPGAVACKCPECDAELVFTGTELIARAGDMHGDEDAAASLGKYENALSMFKNAVANGERDLAAATAAREQLALMKDDQETPTQEDIDALKAKISILRSGRQQASTDLETINKNIRRASEAEAKTQKAAEHHASVQAWDKIASALAPDGIPSEMLHAALDPINTRLSQSAAATGWKSVVINPDMSISYEERPYGLSSASAKWRANAMIAEAISHVAGIKFLMADEFDLLDLPSRSACLKWLIGLARSGEIDSVLLFGTLKEKPAKLPPEIAAYWIQDGVLIEQAVVAAA